MVFQPYGTAKGSREPRARKREDERGRESALIRSRNKTSQSERETTRIVSSCALGSGAPTLKKRFGVSVLSDAAWDARGGEGRAGVYS